MFVNFSNHPSANWSDEQMTAAHQYGEIVDVSFPLVPPDADENEILMLADEQCSRILELDPEIVMCQGEFTLAYVVVRRLKAHGVRVVAACSDRVVEEHGNQKTSRFCFVRFRDFID